MEGVLALIPLFTHGLKAGQDLTGGSCTVQYGASPAQIKPVTITVPNRTKLSISYLFQRVTSICNVFVYLSTVRGALRKTWHTSSAMNEAAGSGLSCWTFFETLPDEIRVTIAEWLDKVWHEYPSTPRRYRGRISFFRLLLSEDGPFCDVICSMLTSITLDLEPDSTNVSIKDGSIDIGPELFEGEELERGLVERVLKACGESTKEIVLAGDDAQLQHRETGVIGLIPQFESLVIQYCPAVERLKFYLPFLNDEIVSSLFAEFSPELRSVVWYTWGPGDSLCFPHFSNCTQIRELALPATPQLTSLLECTGSLLESLFLSFNTFEGYGETLDAIEQHCRKLVHITLPASRRIINSVGERRYAAFLCSYGNQLITAEIDGMVEPEYLLEVFTKCSNLNVEFQLVTAHGTEEWEIVRVFGPRIQNLEVDLIACTGEECCHAISSCTALSGLIICSAGFTELMQDSVDTTIFSVLSSLFTPSLKRLTLNGLRAIEENVAMIVAATSNLIGIDLNFAKPVQDGSIFKTIVDSNPHLREVRISEDLFGNGKRDGDSALELLRVLVHTFSKCRSLDFGILNSGEQAVCGETIRDICGSLPCRGIDLVVRIGSTYYMQTHRLGHRVIVPL